MLLKLLKGCHPCRPTRLSKKHMFEMPASRIAGGNTDILPRQGSCVLRLWRRHMSRRTTIRTGKRNWHDCNRGSATTERSWRSLASYWLPSGMCWHAKWQTVSRKKKWSRKRCYTSHMKWARKIVLENLQRNSCANEWIRWDWEVN